jgi:hypothetical protein
MLARLAAARPAAMPDIVGDWLTSTEDGAAVVRGAWRAAVAGWRRQARIDEPACDASFDSLDAIAAWMDAPNPRPESAACDVAALLDSQPPVGAPPGTILFGHWSGTVEGAMIGGPLRAFEAEAAAGVTMAGAPPAHDRRGAAHAVFPDPRRPDIRWPLMPDDALAPRSCRAAVPQRIVEAA